MVGLDTNQDDTLGRRQSLSRLLAVRMAIAAAMVLMVLLAGLVISFFSDMPGLRRAILNKQTTAVAAELRAGRDPSSLDIYTRFPGSYGFRASDHRISEDRRVVGSANLGLLPAMDHESIQRQDGDLRTWFGQLTKAGEHRRGWLLTERLEKRGQHFWIQAVMVGDPADLWFWVIIKDLTDKALLPMVVMAPTLTIAMFLTTRAALRPLTVLARQASRVGGVSGGAVIGPLSSAGLPAEIGDVVAAINRMLSRLTRSQEQQRQFTSDVAHELRTPLAVLSLEVARLPAGLARQHIAAEIASLSSLVTEMLRFAQAEDLFLKDFLPVDVAVVVRRVCEDFAPAALRAGQQIELFGAEEPCMLRGSELLIEIAVRNVVENAVKYSSAGSTVSVTVDRAGRVTVDDRGPGIPATQTSRIYDRFGRAGRTDAIGHGVGLALVQRVVQLHEGEVRFANRLEGGSRFILTFAPASAATAQMSDSMSATRSVRNAGNATPPSVRAP